MHRAALPVVLVTTIALAGCRMKGDSNTAGPHAEIPADQALNSIPLGAPPGEAVSIAASIRNPVEGDPAAVAQGKRLFTAMNCVYCHGAQASGLMGPSLNDQGWRYGGTPAEIYNSIHDGRPKGMPAWGGLLPADQIWKLTAYIETLGGAAPPATTQETKLAGPEASTTGAQPAGEKPADAAHLSLVGARKGRSR